MTEIHAQIRKWGNSLGLILPKEIVDTEHLKENQQITLYLMKPVLAKDLFGTAKTKTNKSTTDILKEIRKEIW